MTVNNKDIAIIDTMQVALEGINGIDESMTIEEKSRKVIENSTDEVVRIDTVCKVSIHKKFSEMESNTYSRYMENFRGELDKLGIGNVEVVMNRLDVAYDTNQYSFDTIKGSKMLNYFAELIACRFKDKSHLVNVFDTINRDDYKQNSIFLKCKRDMKISIYHKKLESPNHLWDTRIEFRLDRKSRNINDKKGFLSVYDIAIDTVKASVNNIDSVNALMIEKLVKIYNREIKENQVKTFTEFVRKYNKLFFTSEIMQGVYDGCMKGKWNNWLREYKRTNDIEFINKTELNNFTKGMIKQLKYFRNN